MQWNRVGSALKDGYACDHNCDESQLATPPQSFPRRRYPDPKTKLQQSKAKRDALLSARTLILACFDAAWHCTVRKSLVLGFEDIFHRDRKCVMTYSGGSKGDALPRYTQTHTQKQTRANHDNESRVLESTCRLACVPGMYGCTNTFIHTC